MQISWTHARFFLYLGFFASLFVFTMSVTEPQGVDAQGFNPPSITNVRIGTSSYGTDVNPLNLTAGANTAFHINGSVTDLDGATDIATVSAVFYRSSIGSFCGSDKNNCYIHPSCATANASGTSLDYNCEIDVAFYADPTSDGSTYASDTWNVKVTAQDFSFLQDVDDTYTNEINSLRAISVASGISYGNFDLGQTSSSSATLSITNHGNIETDAEFSSNGINCTFGSIAPTYQKFDTIDWNYASMAHTLASTPVDANLWIPKQTQEGFPSSQTVYWRIQVPSVGVSGNCNGITTITAISP